MAHVRIYSTFTCGFCVAAKRFLRSNKQVDFEDIDVTGDRAARTSLRESTGSHTVPQIFIGDTYVGGYTELMALERSGKLDALLQG
jgi:glutaredoxin 3